MSPHHRQTISRRRLLQFLAASPLFARSAFAEGPHSFDPVEWAPRDLDKLIGEPKQALDVFDFEPVMKKNVPPAHFGYMATGVDDEVTLARQSRGLPKARAAATTAGRCQQDRHARRNPRRDLRQRRSSSRRPAATVRFILTARSRSPRPRGSATICRSCPRSRRHLSKTPSLRAARQSGFNSTRRSDGRLPKDW